MKSRFSVDRGLVLRVADFLDRSRTVTLDYLEDDLIELIAACRILGLLGDPAGIPSLIRALERHGENRNPSDRFVLKNAADALTSIGEEAVQPLITLLESEKPETRKFAAYALGKIGNRRAFPALARVAGDPKEPKLVREVAGRAMQRLNPEKAEEIVDPDSFVEAEDPRSGFKDATINSYLEMIDRYCGSINGLGPPSEYKLSVSLYNYIEEAIKFYNERRLFMVYLLDDTFNQLTPKLNLPRKLVTEAAKPGEHFLLCLCGENLEWKFVDSLSNRFYEFANETIERDIMCVYCRHCKRYTGLTRKSSSEWPPDRHTYNWFYLPRFPKRSELISEEELEERPPKIERYWDNST